MPERKPVPVWPVFAAIIVLMIPLAAYVAGYFWLAASADGNVGSDERIASGTPYTVREYRKRWMAVTFTPLGWLEAKVRGRVVYLDSLDRNEWEAFPP